MHVGPVISLDTLPDDVLLAIFNWYPDELGYEETRERAWQSLVHVCHRWRSIIFGSPRFLKLKLVCTESTRARDLLDVWTALPLVILYEGNYRMRNVDNAIAVLERTDRVSQINLLKVPLSDLERILAAMQQAFPELTFLRLWAHKATVPVVPDSFLGGFAPRLEYLALRGLPFPSLTKLLLSATRLVILYLTDIPHSGYISPDTMATTLSTLTSLEKLDLRFNSPRSCPDRASRRSLPSTRSVLPVLTLFWFKGVTEYLEDLVAHIDTPQLNDLTIAFFNDVVFDTPQLMQFISRTPMLTNLERAHINLWDEAAYVNFSTRTSGRRGLNVEIFCRGLDWQLSSLEQVCTPCLSTLSMLEDLCIYMRPRRWLDWEDQIQNGLWLELLRPFTAVKNLYLSDEFTPRIAPALRELVGGRTTEVLPALQNIFLEGYESSGPVEEDIGHLVSARQAGGHPIAISSWADSKKEKITQYYFYS